MFFIILCLLSCFYGMSQTSKNDTKIYSNYYSNVIYFPSIGVQIEDTIYTTINSITITNKGNYLILFEGIVYALGEDLNNIYLLCQISYPTIRSIDKSNRQILPASNSVSQISTSAIVNIDKIPQIIIAECAVSDIPAR